MNLLTAASVAACHDAQMTTSSSPETAAPATGRAFGTIGVIGLGTMGAGIAEVCARAGLDVIVAESSDQAADAGRERLTASLTRAQERGKLDNADEVLRRITVGTDLAAVAVEVVDRLLTTGGELVTLVRGADADDALVAAVAGHVRRTRRDVEVSVLDGGQERYPLLVGVE